MTYGAKINGVDTKTEFGLIVLADITIGAPMRKEMVVDVPCMDGVLDMSDFCGTRYQNRQITFNLFKPCGTDELTQLNTALMFNWQGRQVDIELPCDTLHTYTGIVHFGAVNGYNQGVIPVTVTAQPYKTVKATGEKTL